MLFAEGSLENLYAEGQPPLKELTEFMKVFIGCEYEKKMVIISSQVRCDTVIHVPVHFLISSQTFELDKNNIDI